VFRDINSLSTHCYFHGFREDRNISCIREKKSLTTIGHSAIHILITVFLKMRKKIKDSYFFSIGSGKGPLQLLEGCSKVSPQLALLQAEQPQLSQPFHIAEVLQPSDHLCGPPLNLLQQLHVLLVLRAPELDAVLQVGSHQSRAEGQNHLPCPAGHASLDAVQDVIALDLRHISSQLLERSNPEQSIANTKACSQILGYGNQAAMVTVKEKQRGNLEDNKKTKVLS